jgi:hypothetical protein
MTLVQLSQKKGLSFTCFALVSCALAPCAVAQPLEYLSNLQNRFPQQGIGDIHSVFAYGPTTASFTTGSNAVQLGAIRLEFIDAKPTKQAPDPISNENWGALDLRLQSASGGTADSVRLSKIAVNTSYTQWPQTPTAAVFTLTIDFGPSDATYLPPLTPFLVTISVPTGKDDEGMLYTMSPAYDSQNGWKMGPTTSKNPFAAGEWVKMGILATAVPEPPVCAIATLAAMVFLASKKTRGLKNSAASCTKSTQPDEKYVT